MDPYAILGVPRTANAAAIKAAYHRLAKQLHPDLNPGDKSAEERFKLINAARDLLLETQKSSHQRGRNDQANSGSSTKQGQEKKTNDDLPHWWVGLPTYVVHDLLREARNGPINVAVDFLQAALGARIERTLYGRLIFVVDIPAGSKSKDIILARTSMPRGGYDYLQVTLKVGRSGKFKRIGNDIQTEVKVGIKTAVLGGPLTVETIHGKVTAKVPPNTGSEGKLRLRGMGIAGGDHFIRLKVVVPRKKDPKLEAFLKTWEPT